MEYKTEISKSPCPSPKRHVKKPETPEWLKQYTGEEGFMKFLQDSKDETVAVMYPAVLPVQLGDLITDGMDAPRFLFQIMELMTNHTEKYTPTVTCVKIGRLPVEVQWLNDTPANMAFVMARKETIRLDHSMTPLKRALNLKRLFHEEMTDISLGDRAPRLFLYGMWDNYKAILSRGTAMSIVRSLYDCNIITKYGLQEILKVDSI